MQGNNDLFTVLLARATSGGGGGEGFTPTDEQLAAMNSGITSTDVEQISINENNILIENVTSHFTAKTGFTIQTNYTKIFKQGMHIFGKMVVKKDSGTFSNTTQEQIVETDYKMNSQYFPCAFADDLYRCNYIGYCFMGISDSKGVFIVRDTVTGSNNYVVLSIDFIAQ